MMQKLYKVIKFTVYYKTKRSSVISLKIQKYTDGNFCQAGENLNNIKKKLEQHDNLTSRFDGNICRSWIKEENQKGKKRFTCKLYILVYVKAIFIATLKIFSSFVKSF